MLVRQFFIIAACLTIHVSAGRLETSRGNSPLACTKTSVFASVFKYGLSTTSLPREALLPVYARKHAVFAQVLDAAESCGATLPF